MKAIMISIQPQRVEKILNGEKTIEIRKTMPKCELPCKVYIYCTQAKPYLYRLDDDDNFELTNNLRPHEDCFVKDYNALNGKVVAEFTLNKVSAYDWDADFLNTKQNMYYIKSGEADKTCLTYEQLRDYGKGKDLYGWHIDNLKIYDKPKELHEFYGEKECPYKDWGDVDNIGCWESYCEMFSRGECRFGHLKLDRPPQSWCYVEEMKSE